MLLLNAVGITHPSEFVCCCQVMTRGGIPRGIDRVDHGSLVFESFEIINQQQFQQMQTT